MAFGPILRAMLRNKIGVILLLIEIGVTLAIVLNCAGMVITQRKRLNKNTGLDEARLMLIEHTPFGEAYAEREFRKQIVATDLGAIRALPGVIDACIISPVPLQGGGSSMITNVRGAPAHEGVRTPVYGADANFINTLGLELIAGRTFIQSDFQVETGPYAANALITQDLADALFPDGNALGQLLDTGSEEYADTVVGIVKHMFTPFGGSAMETRIVFYPDNIAGSSYFTYLVRVDAQVFDSLFTAIPELMVDLQQDRVVGSQTMTEIKSGGLLMERMMANMLTIVIILLLFITAIGLAGMTAFAVARRTKQIGIRRAIGATKSDILGYFLVENSLVILAGMALGLVGGIILNRILISTADVEPLPFGLAISCVLFLLVLGWIATLLPALRATKIEPAIATRTV